MGALNIAKSFATQSITTIDQMGKTNGFWKYYSNTSVSTKAFREELLDKYMSKMIKDVTKEASPSLQNQYNNIIDDLQEIKEFETAAEKICDNSVSTMNYNKGSGTFFFYIYNFNPFYNELRHHISIQVSKIMMRAECQLGKDWMIVTKVKSSFFSSTACSELHYLEDKSIQLKDIAEVIAMAFAPAILGLVQLPERFIMTITNICQKQLDNPEPGYTPPTAEQRQQTLNIINDYRTAAFQRLDKAGEFSDKIIQHYKEQQEKEEREKKEKEAATKTQG